MFQWLFGKKREAEQFALPTIPSKSNSPGDVSIFEPVMSDSGAVITEDSALRVATVLTCLQIIYDAVQMVRGHVYRRTPNGKEIATDHPAERLLHFAPNDYMTAGELYGLGSVHRASYGNGYAVINRNPDNSLESIQPLLPDRTTCVIENENLVYRSMVGGTTVYFSPAEIIHLKGLGFDGLCGYPILRLLRQDIGTEKATAEFQAKFYSSGANMGGVITPGGKVSPDARDRIRRQLQNDFQGNSNAFKILMLEEPDWKFEKFGVAPEDSQMVEGRKLLMRRIAAAFKIPPHMIGDDTRTSFASLEQENRDFYIRCVNPYLRAIEDQINLKVFTEAEKASGEIWFEFNRMAFLEADLQVQTAHWHQMLLDRVYTPNEVREFLGFNKMPGGDKPLSTPNNNAGEPDSDEGNATPPAEGVSND